MVTRLGDSVSFFKVGLQLIYAGGVDLARRLAGEGKQVFLDGKLLDIDNTVEGAVESIVPLGVTFLTIHAYPKAMRAAVAARGTAPLRLLGVTVLTSMDDADLSDAGFAGERGGRWSPPAPRTRRPPAWTASSPPPPRPRPSAASSARTWRSSPPASVRRAPAAATRSASPRRRAPSPPAPTTWSSAVRSPPRPTREAAADASSPKSRPRWKEGKSHEQGLLDRPCRYQTTRRPTRNTSPPTPRPSRNTAAASWSAAASSRCFPASARARNVVIEFKDFDTALACYRSPEYQHAIAERGTSAEVDVLVIEGYDGPQPADG